MEGVRTFLESSTIHGLSHISSTQKFARVFWCLVVMSGFTVAFLIIQESFSSWSESPIKTTIETLPISEIKFPKVTVCPPKNAYTDLNYDLMLTESMILTESMRDEMFEYAFDVLMEDIYPRTNWTKLYEEDRGYNWYHGYTRIIAPENNKNFGLHFRIHTSTTSGVVTTQYYREQFQPELIERKYLYEVKVNPPESVLENENVTLHFKAEKISMKGFDQGFPSKDYFFMENTGGTSNADQKIVSKNFTPPRNEWRYIQSARDVTFEEVENIKMDMMPGFKFRWWYTGVEITPETKYKDDEINKQFVRFNSKVDFESGIHVSFRFINIQTHSGMSNSEIWLKVRTFRVKQLKQYSNGNFKFIFCFTNEELISTIEEFARFVGVQNTLDEVNGSLSKSTLNNGAEMFQFLYSCPSFYVKLYLKTFYGNKTSTTLAMLASKIAKKAHTDFKDKAIRIFAKVASVLGFQFISQYNKDNQSFERNFSNIKGLNGRLVSDICLIFPLC